MAKIPERIAESQIQQFLARRLVLLINGHRADGTERDDKLKKIKSGQLHRQLPVCVVPFTDSFT